LVPNLELLRWRGSLATAVLGEPASFDTAERLDYYGRMDSPENLAGIAEIIDFAISREREARRTYLAFAQTTDRKGFRQLLLTMADMEGEHEKRLLELQRSGPTAGLFRPPRGADLRFSGQLKEVRFSADMEYGDFLVLVMKKESEAEELYTRLAGLAQNAEVRSLFELLAREEATHRGWAQERYDEDILREN
jgi:rubrerythrin